MLEKELREPVTKWLQSKGYDVVVEFLLGHFVDMIGCKFGERIGRRIPPLIYTVSVELKLYDVGGVILQARNNRLFVNESWAAMPENRISKMVEKSFLKFGRTQIGLLSVKNGGRVCEIIPAKINYRLQRRLWQRLHEGPESAMIKSWEKSNR